MQYQDCLKLIESIQIKLQVEYSFLAQWQVGFDNAKRRAGLCRLDGKKISISRWHIEHNDEVQVKDTLLHEFAHAISFELYGDTGHGKCWKQVARKIGATPLSRGMFATPQAPWYLVVICKNSQSVEKVAPRFRRNRKIRRYFLKGRPATQGNLYYLSRNQWQQYEASQLGFEQLTLVQ